MTNRRNHQRHTTFPRNPESIPQTLPRWLLVTKRKLNRNWRVTTHIPNRLIPNLSRPVRHPWYGPHWAVNRIRPEWASTLLFHVPWTLLYLFFSLLRKCFHVVLLYFCSFLSFIFVLSCIPLFSCVFFIVFIHSMYFIIVPLSIWFFLLFPF
jgi:hypothetical protein